MDQGNVWSNIHRRMQEVKLTRHIFHYENREIALPTEPRQVGETTFILRIAILAKLDANFYSNNILPSAYLPEVKDINLEIDYRDIDSDGNMTVHYKEKEKTQNDVWKYHTLSVNPHTAAIWKNHLEQHQALYKGSLFS